MIVQGISRRSHLVAAVTVLAATLLVSWLVYGGNRHHVILEWDDIVYVSTNPWVIDPSWENMRELFTRSRLGNWHPLTWMSYIPEYRLCGDKAVCYKATNITLHGFNSFLVFWLGYTVLRITPAISGISAPRAFGASAIAGLLFAAHPQHVESVMWISERKDLLCAMFFLLSMIFYLRRHSNPGGRSSPLPYLFFALALMSKSMAVTLPAVLILLDLWPLSRLQGAGWRGVLRICVWEKLHFHLATVLLILVTLLTQEIDSMAQPSLMGKALIVASSLRHYLASFLFPVDLSPFYPVSVVVQQSSLGFVSFVGAILAGIALGTARFGAPFVAWLAFFFVTLAPVIGVVKVGEQAFADRYTYLPMVGFYLVTGLAIASLPLRDSFRRIAIPVLTATLMLWLGANSREYKEVWQSDLRLWRHAAQRYAGLSATLHNNLGGAYFRAEQYASAIRELETAVEVDPTRADFYGNLGRANAFVGNAQAALRAFELAVEKNPLQVGTYVEAGGAHNRFGNPRRAMAYYTAALELDPANPPALLGLGKSLLILGDTQRFASVLERVPANSPESLDAQLLLAQGFGRFDKPRALRILDQIEAQYGAIKEVALVRARLE